MPLLSDILAWAAITIGGASAAYRLIVLAAGWVGSRRPGCSARPQRAMTERSVKREAWEWFRYSLFLVCGGVFVLDRGWKDVAARWLVLIAASTITAWDRVLWFRSRLRRRSARALRPGGPGSEPGCPTR